MKKLLLALSFAVATAVAADKEVTIQGEGKCAKCALKETDKCQNVVEVTKDGKKTKYYFADNQVSKDFHKNLCTTTAKVKATGTTKKVGEKMEFTATKIELDKEKEK